MKSLVKEHLNFKNIYERLDKKEDVSAKYLNFQLEVISWNDLPSSEVIPTSVKSQDKLILAYSVKSYRKDCFEDSYTNDDDSYYNGDDTCNVDETCNGNACLGNSILDDTADKDEIRYPGVSLGKARSLLSLFCLWKDESTLPTTPLWVMCDGNASEHVFLMGCSWQKNEVHNHVINTYTISCQGPYHNKSEIPSVQHLMEGFCQSEIVNVTANGYAQYDVLGASFSERSASDLGGASSVIVECEWEDVEIMLEVPHCAKCKLNINAVPGDSRITSYKLYQELQMLKGFITGIEKGEVKWANHYTDEHSTFFKTLEQLLVEEGSNGNVGRVAEEKKLQEDEGLCEKFDIQQRNDLDFTERLWNHLKDSRNLQELRMALQMVMQTLKTGDFFPVVHVHNESRLASQIRACYQQQTPHLNLEAVEPLEILIEMGLEKLRRDYIDYFIRHEVVLHEQLGFFLESKISTHDQIERLCKMHNVLELLVVTAMLNLPLQDQQALCRLGLKYYEKFPSDSNQTFQLPVEAGHLYGIYSKCQPRLWRIDIAPEESLDSALYQLSFTQPFDAALSTRDETKVVENGNIQTYYSIHVRRNHTKPLLG
ncbi:protein zwilch homolog [Antedon mediterranea]|uniref:protein zwilch homolog n=1 Tax=Antedon mediterranea TaxID=105859 RepID=UPI003AF93762